MNKPLVTTEQKFSDYGSDGERSYVFAVNAGVGGECALNQASDLIASVLDAVKEAAMGKPLQGNQAWLVHHSLASAKAVVDALSSTYQFDDGM
ncbi:DUF3077 domain-containing protein [Pseudomonas baltica]|uniref:DUF3077 domain-containing protein n=1 Tax=Pseudomonas baltica TaxID=2762576 RepID=UPI002896D539|nr:DUF3077 domain-containing protein [Pseudomonas baltica]